MLNALNTLMLTSAAPAGDSLPMIALAVAILALVLAFIAMSRARRAGTAANLPAQETLTGQNAAFTPPAQAAAPAAAGDNNQLVAVITAAIAALLADEHQAAAAGSAQTGRTSRQPAVQTAMPAGNGPYPGFVVRRIRRV